MAAPSHVWRVVTCSLCLVQVNFHVHTCHVSNYIFCLSRARIVSDYQSYIAHHIALQEHNSITLHTASVTTTCKYEEQPDVIPGTIPIQRQSIIPRFEELSPSSMFSIPRLSFTSSLPPYMLCLDQSLLELNSDPGSQAGLRLSLLLMLEEVSVRMITVFGPKRRCTSQVSC